MLRITNLRLPLNHDPQAFDRAVRQRLGLKDAQQLLSTTVFRRAYDARKKTAIVLIYTRRLRAQGPGRGRLLRQWATATSQPRHALPPHRPAPHRLCAHARPRPVVVGFGPCGICSLR
jgi:uncharacterized FAD-dependent dehydrogenase